MKNINAKMSPARPTRPAAMPPTTALVEVLPVPVDEGLALAEEATVLEGPTVVNAWEGSMTEVLGRTWLVAGYQTNLSATIHTTPKHA